MKDITVKAGQEIKIAIPIKGWPIPTAVWKIGDKELEVGGRVKIEVRIILKRTLCVLDSFHTSVRKFETLPTTFDLAVNNLISRLIFIKICRPEDLNKLST